MEPHSANAALLVRPAAFGFNAEAAQSNAFAQQSAAEDLQRAALAEFDRLAEALDGAGVMVMVLDDTPHPAKPDAVFPNNWFTTHADGTMVLYPMATAPRRLERREADVRAIFERNGLDVSRTVDLTAHERQGKFLEGTGSLLLDRARHRAIASLGPRTDRGLIAEFDRELGYSTFVFDARDPDGRPIYHTNVLLSLGSDFAVLCREAVAPEDLDALVAELESSGRTIIDLNFGQLCRFGCNLLELRSRRDQPVIAMSANALSHLDARQRRSLENFGEIVAVAIPTIEAVGGGSVRCMIADVHLPRAMRGS